MDEQDDVYTEAARIVGEAIDRANAMMNKHYDVEDIVTAWVTVIGLSKPSGETSLTALHPGVISTECADEPRGQPGWVSRGLLAMGAEMYVRATD